MRGHHVAPHWSFGHPGLSAMPVSPKMEALEREALHDPGAVGRFLEEHSFPLAEPPLYTFVFQGTVRGVRLRHWIHGLASSQPFRRLDGTDLWYHTLDLPDDSRVEYKFEVLHAGGSEWMEDPFNANRAHDPFGANSVVTARGYEYPEWALAHEDAPKGSFDDLVVESEVLGGSRHVKVYRPARYRPSRKYPLLVVHDGPDYLRFASLGAVLDNLIHRLEIPGLIVALTQPEARMGEYAADPDHARYVVEELVPRLEADYPLIAAPESRGLMGASLGAVASFHTALAYPGRFERLLLQSGTFAFTDIGGNENGPIFDRIVDMMNGYRASPTRIAKRTFVSVGVYEPLVSEARALMPVLRRTGADLRFVEARDGHNWENWRDRLREGLSWLFPGPLWMVYE